MGIFEVICSKGFIHRQEHYGTKRWKIFYLRIKLNFNAPFTISKMAYTWLIPYPSSMELTLLVQHSKLSQTGWRKRVIEMSWQAPSLLASP